MSFGGVEVVKLKGGSFFLLLDITLNGVLARPFTNHYAEKRLVGAK